MRFLTDPRIFNYVILGLYAMNVARWSYAGKFGPASYWLGAFVITASVTFLEQH